ncbi:MAG TPA: alcohol dehydrogenase catalytic domain-containing protein, partial [Steroidobacteraceae bacterium]|nr:alcohol dehydrogenase catalytic domain-containing protein [Steroidobacteraceae bacterium]
MRLTAPGAPLELTELSLHAPGEHELLIAVEACGVCRTDLHVLDGELPDVRCPLTLGHEVVGR